LSGGEVQARQRALDAIAAAKSLHSSDPLPAIAKWLQAASEVSSITQIDAASWRLAITRLLEISQRRACGLNALCGNSVAEPTIFTNDSLFKANAALERLEVRGGKPGAADWEFGLGSNTQTAGLFVQAEHTWVSGVAYRYVLSYSGTGGGNIKLYNGATLLFDKTYTGTAPLRVGDALQLYVKSSAGIGNAVVAVTADKVNGLTTSGAIATRGDNVFNELRLNYFYPPMKSSFVIEGTVKLTFTGTIPTGSRLNFMINSGNLICNGGAL
jgi:hypothetical protein